MRDTKRLRTLNDKEKTITGRLGNAMSMDAIETLEGQLQNVRLLISKLKKSKK